MYSDRRETGAKIQLYPVLPFKPSGLYASFIAGAWKTHIPLNSKPGLVSEGEGKATTHSGSDCGQETHSPKPPAKISAYSFQVFDTTCYRVALAVLEFAM